MGRKKIQIKRIEDRNSRHVTFAKRRNGLLKKAKQLSILCDVQIAAIIFSDLDKVYQFSHGDSLVAILQRYYEVSCANENKAIGKQESKISESAGSRGNIDLLQSVQRYIDELNIDGLPMADIVQLEKELESGLVKTRARKVSINTQHIMEPIEILQEKEKLLIEENKLLTQQIAALAEENLPAKEMDENMEENIELRNLVNDETDHSRRQQTLRLLI